MGSRMDRYNDTNIDNIPKRSVRNQELYKQVYNAYDDFENLVVPSNAKEIDLSTLKKEISSRDEYRKIKDYGDITNNKVIRKEIIQEEQKRENEIYDINVLMKNAVENNKEDVVSVDDSVDYLSKLKLDDVDLSDDVEEEIDEELLKTANLSLDLLADLKGDNENTMVDAPAFDEIVEDDSQFYSGKYKFSADDFEENQNKTEIDDSFVDDLKPKKGRLVIKILVFIILIIFIAIGAMLMV